MIKKNRRVLAIGAALACALAALAETVTMHTPEGFQIMSISPNAKWACGVYVDATMEGYGFRWNLESGSIEMLGSDACVAWDVANDGTVSGEFGDTEALETGAAVILPGYWRDGRWHHLEMPEGTPAEGVGAGISPDGHYMTGSVAMADGVYRAYIWKDGKIHSRINHNDHSVMYAVAPDGSGATGWVMTRNRTACYWSVDGDVTKFTDSEEYSYSPWNYGRNFSPDGTKLLYWGGWSVEGDDVYLYSIYDLATGERIKVKAPAYESDVEFHDISNNGLLVGQDRGRGFVWTGTEGMVIDDYLTARGVDLSTFDDFYTGADYYQNELPINCVVAVSEDESCFAMRYYNTRGQLSSMVVKIDQDLTAVTPAEVSATQLEGLGTVAVRWHRPVGANVRGYNVYRDGKKVSGVLPLNVPYFYDKNLAPGTYTYEVSAVSTAGIETRAQALQVQVDAQAPQAPYALYGRRRGAAEAHLSWSAPLGAGAHKHYYDPAITDYEAFAVYQPMSVELAVAYDRNEMAQYSGHRLEAVSFVPMAEQNGWKINVYSRGADGALTLLASQPVDASSLVYRQMNTIALSTPVALPAADLLVAVEVDVKADTYEVLGTDRGRVTAGYSDLLRSSADPDFMSAYESSAASGMNIYCMSWGIDLTLAKDGDQAPAVKTYHVYVDGQEAGTSDACSYITDALADGTHTLGVLAEYADGTTSACAEATLKMKAAYPSIDRVKVDTGADGSTAVTATWQAPADNDRTDIAYTRAKEHAHGFTGVEENGYALMAAQEYPARMMRGYQGYQIESLRFYPLADAIFTLMLYEDGNLVAEYEVPEFALGCWNEVTLPTPVTVRQGCGYRLVVDCFDPEPAVGLLAVDKGHAVAYMSDLYSVDNGETWKSTSTETSVQGSWMMGMVITDGTSSPMAVSGYDVVVDGVVSNVAPVSGTAYTHDFGKLDDKQHSLRVDAYYPGRAEAVSGESVSFTLSVSGIADAAVAEVSISLERGWLEAAGDGVLRVEVYTTAGAMAAAADAARVDVSSLAAGVYLVKVHTAQGIAAGKVRID